MWRHCARDLAVRPCLGGRSHFLRRLRVAKRPGALPRRLCGCAARGCHRLLRGADYRQLGAQLRMANRCCGGFRTLPRSRRAVARHRPRSPPAWFGAAARAASRRPHSRRRRQSGGDCPGALAAGVERGRPRNSDPLAHHREFDRAARDRHDHPRPGGVAHRPRPLPAALRRPAGHYRGARRYRQAADPAGCRHGFPRSLGRRAVGRAHHWRRAGMLTEPSGKRVRRQR